jgi:hypothetical protein
MGFSVPELFVRTTNLTHSHKATKSASVVSNPAPRQPTQTARPRAVTCGDHHMVTWPRIGTPARTACAKIRATVRTSLGDAMSKRSSATRYKIILLLVQSIHVSLKNFTDTDQQLGRGAHNLQGWTIGTSDCHYLDLLLDLTSLMQTQTLFQHFS